MYGKVIGTSICVDCFNEITKDGIYFLTEGQLENPLPAHVDRVYTSPYNAWLLQTRFQIDPEKIVSLPINEKLLIQDKVKKLNFHVTLMDANQKPGAVMFLFEGDDIGNVLYAGKCCYKNNCLSRTLQNFLKQKTVDFLFVHEACHDCHSHSLPVRAAVEEIVNIARWNPNCKLIINDPCFREDILSDLKAQLKKPVCVSEKLMKHLEEVGRGTDFVLNQTEAQVIVVDNLYDRMEFDEQLVFKIILIPCSMKRSSQEIKVKLYKLEKKGFHVIFYRNHCSPLELVSVARFINAKHTVLIRPSPKVFPVAGRRKDLNFWSYLGDFQKFIDFSDGFQIETNQLESPEENNFGVSDAELQNAVKCIMENEENRLVKMDKTDAYTDCSEASTPTSFILIDSDIESVVSKETVLNEPAGLC